MPPRQPGVDTITIIHRPSNTRRQVSITILPVPQIVLSAQRRKLNCGEKLALKPLVKAGESMEKLEAEQFIFSADQGHFVGNVYQAPQREAKVKIDIRHPGLEIESDFHFTVVAQPVLVADVKSVVVTGEKVPLDIYLRKGEQTIALTPTDYQIQTQHGRCAGKVYHAPGKSCQDTIIVTHKPSGQSVTLELTVRQDISLQVDVAKTNLKCRQRLPVKVRVYRGDNEVKTPAAQITFSAKRGKFMGDIYQAPAEAGKDIISVLHRLSWGMINIALDPTFIALIGKFAG